jgi:hypothetical protein
MVESERRKHRLVEHVGAVGAAVLAPRLGAVLEAEREMRLPADPRCDARLARQRPHSSLQAVTADTPAGARPAAAGKSHRRSVGLPPLQRGTCGELLARVRAEAA